MTISWILFSQEILVDRAVHAAIGRHLSCQTNVSKYTLVKEDFTRAMHEFVPVAMRDITKSASEGGRSGWEDVGGVTDVKNAIKEVYKHVNCRILFFVPIKTFN